MEVAADQARGGLGRRAGRVSEHRLRRVTPRSRIHPGERRDVQGSGGVGGQAGKGTGDYTITTPDHTSRTFDSSGQLTSVVDAAGKGLSLTYVSGELASVKDATGRTTTFTTGTDGLLSKVSLPDGTSVSYGYTDGLLTSVTDPAGKTSSYAYDANKRLSSYTDPESGKVTNVYDATGRITSQTDQNGKTTTFTWDGDRESHTTAPDGGVWTDVYSGNVLMETIDPYGKSITYDYDRHLRPSTSPTSAATPRR
ncbi:hypothetical protein SUDANB106_00104 [Streptomyces sp. enrichment culture]